MDRDSPLHKAGGGGMVYDMAFARKPASFPFSFAADLGCVSDAEKTRGDERGEKLAAKHRLAR